MKENTNIFYLLRIANENRNHEIILFWRRYVFFFIATFIIILFYIFSYRFEINYNIFIILFSTILSFIWVLLNRGGKYLIESWELKLKRYERPYILFRKIEPVKRSGPWGAVRLSTNKLLIALADFIFVFNLLILLFDFYLNYLINIFPALPNFFADKNEIFVIAIILLSSFIFMLIILLNAKITTYVCDTLDGYTFLIEKKGRWFKYVKYKNDEDRIIRIERFQSINDFKITDKDLPVVREIISKFPKVSKL